MIPVSDRRLPQPPGSSLIARTGRMGLLVAGAALLAALLSGCGTSPEALDLTGSNLLLITVDTLRVDRVGAFGDQQARTRTLDALAAGGISFSNTYAPAPLTLPSHSALFTARYPFSLNVRNNGGYFLRAAEETLAERLEAAGYSTAAFVSSYVLASRFGLDQGFSTYDDSLETKELIRSFTSEVPADRVVDRFERWFQTKPDGPFFAWLHFYDPHLPYSPPSPFAEAFESDPYRGEVAFVDDQLRRALEVLESRSQRDNTLIVVTSDHGESFGEHGEMGHGILAYDESLKVPLILNARDQLPVGRRIEERVRLIDLAPTLLDLLGLPALPETAGKSMRQLLLGRSEEAQREVYFESVLGAEDYNWAPITGLISGQHKYISLPQPELYDLSSDGHERRNLYRAMPGVASQLDERLQAVLLARKSTDAGARRELSREDISHLEALGYLGAAERSETVIDPKQGIRLDGEIKRIRALVDSGVLAQARDAAAALASESVGLSMPGLIALRHEIEVRLGDQSKAVDILINGIDALPDSSRLRFLLANYQLQIGHLAAAAETSRALLEIDPNYSQAWIVLGQAAETEGDFGKAVEHYGKALEKEPLSVPLRRRRAEALLRSGSLGPAAEELILVADRGGFDDDPGQLYRLGVIIAQTGDSLLAQKVFERGLHLAPAGLHHITFSLLLLRNQYPERARRHLEIALDEFGHELTPDQQAMARATLDQLPLNQGK